MNYAGIIEDDIADCTDGFCVSLWFNGCDIRCKGCHNKTCWDTVNKVENIVINNALNGIIDKAYERGIPKSLSILGGEPLSPDNREDCYEILHKFAEDNPGTDVRLWTGRTKEQLAELCKENKHVAWILNWCHEIIVGPFIEELRKDLPLRGSSNQEILVNGKDYKADYVKGSLVILNGD